MANRSMVETKQESFVIDSEKNSDDAELYHHAG